MTKYKKIAVLVSSLLVIGCGALDQRAEVYKDTYDGAKQALDMKVDLAARDRIMSSPVREIDGYWLGGRTIKVSRDAELPAIFSRTITFQFPDKPSLSIIGDRIGKITSLPVRITSDALKPLDALASKTGGAPVGDPGVPMFTPPVGGLIGATAPTSERVSTSQAFILDRSSPYNGSLKDLLDQVSARYGVGWDFKDGTITISRIVTRNYSIASLIDVNETKTTIAKSSGASTESAGGGSQNAAQPTKANSNSEVNSTVQSKLDVIDGIKKAIEATLTPDIGKYSISMFGGVTVTDTREVQAIVEEIINAENRSIGRQIRLRFVMVEVEASTKNDTGFDITAAIAKLSDKWKFDFSTPGGMLGGGTNAGMIGILRDGRGATTEAFIKAMSDVGRVSLRRNETYTLMNNRPLSIAQVDNFVYPARSTPGFAADGGAGSGTAGVEPGQLTTGNFLNLRASVQANGSVIINFNLDASRRGQTTTFDSNGLVLQYPQSNGGNYQTYASIPNGQTGIIAAIDTSSMEATDRSIDSTVNPMLGGGIYNNKVVKSVLIMITPYVIEGAI